MHSTLALLRTLVAFDTTSRNSNLALIDYIHHYLTDLGIPTEYVYSPDKTKASLLAAIGQEKPGGLVFSGHTDVVPVDGQDWESHPFTLTEKDGRLYGRGTADMKGFLAVVLALAPQFQAMPLSIPLYLAFSHDEEIGCLGAPALADALTKRGHPPALAVIGEPTGMKIINRHKSIHTFHMTVTGHEAHSSAVDKGVNAIAIAAEIIQYISSLQKERAGGVSPDGKYFDPPFTTLHVGTIHGGTAHNIIPKQCGFEWEIRSLPGEDTEALIRQVEDYAQRIIHPFTAEWPEVSVVNQPDSAVPGLKTNPDTAIENLLMSLAGTNSVEAVSFATEAGIFQSHAIPAIVCGPGNIMQAHKPNEYVEISQLEQCERFITKLVQRFT